MLAWLAVAGAAIEFLFRAIARSNGGLLTDLAAPYVSTRLWLRHANPYDAHIFMPTWDASGAPLLGLPEYVSGAHSVYPPITLIPMIPFALLRWPSAVNLFLVCGILLYALCVVGLLRLGWPEYKQWREFASDPLALLFVAFALGLAPIHTAFASQNIVLGAACAAVLTICLLSRQDRTKTDGLWPRLTPWVAGALITLSVCLKPTTGVFLFPWLVRERRWRLIAGVIVACGVIAVVSLEPLMMHQGTAWLASYRFNVANLFTNGGNADVSHMNWENTDHIDLQLVLFAMIQSRPVSSAIAVAIYGAILLIFMTLAGWYRSGGKTVGKAGDLRLLVAAGSLTLGLLPVYSRIYSAIVLLPLVLWCFRHLRFAAAKWLLALLCGFLVNSSAIVRAFFSHSRFALDMPRTWDATVGGHVCWLLLVIGALLTWAMKQQSREALKGY